MWQWQIDVKSLWKKNHFHPNLKTKNFYKEKFFLQDQMHFGRNTVHHMILPVNDWWVFFEWRWSKNTKIVPLDFWKTFQLYSLRNQRCMSHQRYTTGNSKIWLIFALSSGELGPLLNFPPWKFNQKWSASLTW